MKKNCKAKKKAAAQDAHAELGSLHHFITRAVRRIFIETADELRPARPDLADFYELLSKSGTFASADFRWRN